MVAWQEAYFIAANPEDLLRMLSLGDLALFGCWASEAPQVSYNYIANAVDQLTFVEWVAHRGKPLHGMTIVIARGGHRVYNPDRVYALLTMPAKLHTFKPVIGWRNHSDHDMKGRFGFPH